MLLVPTHGTNNGTNICMCWRRRFAAWLACAVLLPSPAGAQVRRPGVARPGTEVLQIPRMPKLVGLTPDSANKLLASSHRQIDSTYRVFSKSPAGTIVSQSPDPGSSMISLGQAPRIVVGIAARQLGLDKIPPTFRMPDSPSVTPPATVPQAPTMPRLVGLTPQQANDLLASRYHRQIDSLYSVPSDSIAGTIIWQSPDSGSVLSAGQPTIAVRVATPFDDVGARVPDLTGRTRDEVADSLKHARLTPGLIDSVPDPAHAGRVVRQDPPGGTTVQRGTRVAVWYGTDPRVRVPRSVGCPRRRRSPPWNARALREDRWIPSLVSSGR